jgi:CubicO group peptidase (beta-lactamase class C family)
MATLNKMTISDPTLSSRVNQAVRELIGPDKLVGAVTLFSQEGKIMHQIAYGMLDRESKAPMPLDAIFRIHSMTKPVTSVAMMMLVERGQVSLADPISKFIPEMANFQVLVSDDDGRGVLVPCERPPTIQDLLRHTAGFDYRVWETPVGQLYRERGVWDVEKSLVETIQILAELPLGYQPGNQWQYSVSPEVMARIVEIISRQRFADFLAQEIFQPLDMSDTGYHVSPNKYHRFVSLYGAADWAKPDVTGRILGEQAQAGAHLLLATPQDSLEAHPHDVIRGGTGLVSTVQDYHRFCLMLLQGGELDGQRILQPETIAQMTQNQLPEPAWQHFSINLNQPGQGFGLGFRVVLNVEQTGQVGSNGEFSWWGAANTSFWVDPVNEIIGVQMSQFMPPNVFPLPDVFKRAVYDNFGPKSSRFGG